MITAELIGLAFACGKGGKKVPINSWVSQKTKESSKLASVKKQTPNES